MKTRAVKAPGICRLHYARERRLEFIGGIECVVGTCRYCGRKQLCWSRRLLRRKVVEFPATTGRA
jgi:hypothetical protein